MSYIHIKYGIVKKRKVLHGEFNSFLFQNTRNTCIIFLLV